MNRIEGRRGLVALLGMVLLLPVQGCSLFNDEASVEGIWQSQGADRVFLEVTTRRLTTYDFAGDDFERGDDCYRITVANIVTIDEDEYTVSSSTQPALRLKLTLKVVADVLTITADGISETFVQSDREVASFTPTCPAG